MNSLRVFAALVLFCLGVACEGTPPGVEDSGAGGGDEGGGGGSLTGGGGGSVTGGGGGSSTGGGGGSVSGGGGGSVSGGGGGSVSGGGGGSVTGGGGGTPMNTAPVLGALTPITVNEGATTSVTLTATDAENDPITFSLTTTPPFMTLTNATLEIAPGFTQAGTYQLTVHANDGTADTVGTLEVTVVNVNRAPQLAAITAVTMVAGTTQMTQLTATDPDGDALTLSALNLPSWATLSGTTLTFAPPANVVDSRMITITAADASLTDAKTFSLVVNPPANLAPVVSMLAQVDGAGAAVAPGASVTATPRLRAQVDDPENTTVRLEAEVVLLATSFTDVATHSGVLGAEGQLELVLPSLPSGSYKWQLRALDAAGTASPWTSFAAAATAFVVPVGVITGSVAINANQAATNDPNVTLTLSASGTATITEMCFSNDGVTFVQCAAPVTSKSWVLTAGDASKNVFVRVKDSNNVTVVLSDSIILDQTAPQVTGFTINAGATTTNTGDVTLTWTASDALTGVALNEASNTAVFSAVSGSPASWVLSTGAEGSRTVTLRVTDVAGNQTVVTDTITLDKTAPVITSANIEGGVAFINRTLVTFNVVATDGATGVAQVCVTGDATGCRAFGTVQFDLTPGDGPKTVSVTVVDGAGNVSAPTQVSIGLDQATPSLSAISVMSGAPLVNLAFVSVGLTATDSGGSGLSGVQCRTNGGAPGPNQTYAPSIFYTMTAGDGPKTVACTVADAAGNVSGPATDDIILDTLAPTGTFVINAGNPQYTNTPSVTLVFSAADVNGVTHYCANTTGVVPSSAGAPCWTPVASNTFPLPAGDGAKTVSVFFRDAAFNFSTTPATDSITLDVTPPALTVGGAGLGLAAGATFTNQLSNAFVHQALDATSGPFQVCTGITSPPTTCVPWTAAPSALVAAGDGLKTVFIRVSDGAGNLSPILSDTITLDQTLPLLSNVVINTTAPFTNVKPVSITSTASDANGPLQVEFSLDGTTFGAPVAWVTPIVFNLTSPDGAKTVSLRVVDAAGNRSLIASDAITLDETPPGVTISLNGGARYANMNPVSVAMTSSEAGSGVTKYCIKDTLNGAAAPAAPLANDPCFVTFATPANATVGTQSDRRVYVWLLDAAGNITTAPANDVIWHDSVAPGFVAAPTFTAGHRSIALSWTNGADGSSGVQGYEVGTSLVSGGPYVYGTIVPQGAGTTSTTLVVPNGVQQFVVVRTVDNAGNRSTNSVSISATPRYPFSHQQRAPVSAHLRGIAFDATASRYFVAGISGALYSSDDSLTTFTRRDPMTDDHLLAAYVSPSNDVWVVGSGGHVSRSTDDGITFSVMDNLEPSGRDLLSFSSAGTTGLFPLTTNWYVAVGGFGTIVRGATSTLVTDPVFTLVPSGTAQNLTGVARCSSAAGACINGDVLVAVGANGTILRSADNGATWAAIAVPAGYTTAAFTSVVALPGTNTFFIGGAAPVGHGPLIRSVNGALNFTEVVIPSFSDVTGIDALAALGTDLFIGGSTGNAAIIKLNNVTRTDQTIPTGTSVRALVVRSATEVASAGLNGELLLSTAPPAWTRRSLGTNVALMDLSTPATFSSAAWAVGANGTILRTTNSGGAWTAQTSGVGNTLNGIDTVDTNGTSGGVFAFAVGSNGVIVRTTNGGGVWTLDPDSAIVSGSLNDVACRSLTGCLAVGAAGTILTYNGTNWVTTFTGGARPFNAVATWFSGGSTNRAVAVGSTGLLYTLAGVTWVPQADISTNDFFGVAAKSDSLGVVIAVGSGGAIYKSTTHGQSWSARTSGTTAGLRDVANVPGTSVWYAVGLAGLAFKSTDDGETWSPLITSCNDQLNGIALGSIASRAWFGGNNGAIVFSSVAGQ